MRSWILQVTWTGIQWNAMWQYLSVQHCAVQKCICGTAEERNLLIIFQFWYILNLVLHLRITGELTKDSMTTMQLKRYLLLWYFYVAPAISSLLWAKVPSNYEAYYEVCHASTRQQKNWFCCWEVGAGLERVGIASCCCFASGTVIGIHFSALRF